MKKRQQRLIGFGIFIEFVLKPYHANVFITFIKHLNTLSILVLF